MRRTRCPGAITMRIKIIFIFFVFLSDLYCETINDNPQDASIALIRPIWSITKDLTKDCYGYFSDFQIDESVFRMRYIHGGKFLMGSPISELFRSNDERQRIVNINNAFWILETECPQKLWNKVMKGNPSYFIGNDLPVEQVSYLECQQFLIKLNEKIGSNFRLPTEAEWEYTCRAGSANPFYFGNTISTTQANYNGSFQYIDIEKGEKRNKTLPCKSFCANTFGVYDMHGNVSEWCNDWYGDYSNDFEIDPRGSQSGEYRVFRGGSFTSPAKHCRSACRDGNLPGHKRFNVGFRFIEVEKNKDRP